MATSLHSWTTKNSMHVFLRHLDEGGPTWTHHHLVKLTHSCQLDIYRQFRQSDPDYRRSEVDQESKNKNNFYVSNKQCSWDIGHVNLDGVHIEGQRAIGSRAWWNTKAIDNITSQTWSSDNTKECKMTNFQSNALTRWYTWVNRQQDSEAWVGTTIRYRWIGKNKSCQQKDLLVTLPMRSYGSITQECLHKLILVKHREFICNSFLSITWLISATPPNWPCNTSLLQLHNTCDNLCVMRFTCLQLFSCWHQWQQSQHEVGSCL